MTALGNAIYPASRQLRGDLTIAVLFVLLSCKTGAQTLQTIYSFTNSTAPSALTLGNDGAFYGTAQYGGPDDNGTIFRITTNANFTTLVSFDGSNGTHPSAMILGNDGNFYGTTYAGGNTGDGTIFQLRTDGTLTTMVSFTNANGANPSVALTLGADGNLYGTTGGGGTSRNGTVFRVTTNGTLTSLASFNGTNGSDPSAPLTLASDGNFYSTTEYGGSNDDGTIFRLTPDGALTSLASFTGTNGHNPAGGLTASSNGTLYGISSGGSVVTADYGTIFQATTNGILTTLVTFDGTNGAYPVGGLTLGSDGILYGTTARGGSGSAGFGGFGSIFQLSTSGELTTLISFGLGGLNGGDPETALTSDNNGNFYGTTITDGTWDFGTIFRLSLTPIFSTQPRSQTKNAGATAIFTCSTIAQQVDFQWLQNGTNLADAGNASGTTTSTLIISNISDAYNGTYSVLASNIGGTASSTPAILTVIDPPIITAQPTNYLVLAGTSVAFSVSLTGTSPAYQWQFDGTNLLNATNSTYVILSPSNDNAGNYSVALSNAAGNVTSSNAAVVVVSSPVSQNDYAGSTVTFSATAIGPEPISYQWQKNGTSLMNGGNVIGATNATLSLSNLSDANAGIYSAVVNTPYSTVTTISAALTVNDSLTIANQPLSQHAALGTTVAFSITAYGSPPFVFQWYFNGRTIGPPTTGNNFSALILNNVATNDAGNYWVEILNSYGSLSSAYAVLTIVEPPMLALQLSAGYALLSLTGTIGSNFVIQYTTDLDQTNWMTLLSLSNLQFNPYPFLDPTLPTQSGRYYRALMH